MKQFKFILPLIFLHGCGLRTITLQNGYQKAAVNPKVYSNKSKFDKSLLAIIDTLCIYEQYINDNVEKDAIIPARLSHASGYSFYSAYRFYGNGCFNNFILSRRDSVINNKTFDPAYEGWRGVYYKNKNKIKGDLITQVSGMGMIGLLRETFEFKGDTLFITAKNGYESIYVKRNIPIALLQHTAAW